MRCEVSKFFKKCLIFYASIYIFAFLNQSRYVVNLWNRRGDCSSGNGIVEFSKQTLSRLSGRLKVQMVLADSGYYQV